MSRPLEEEEIFNVNILTDWDYRFNFAFLSDRVDFYTNDNTGKNPKLQHLKNENVMYKCDV